MNQVPGNPVVDMLGNSLRVDDHVAFVSSGALRHGNITKILKKVEEEWNYSKYHKGEQGPLIEKVSIKVEVTHPLGVTYKYTVQDLDKVVKLD